MAASTIVSELHKRGLLFIIIGIKKIIFFALSLCTEHTFNVH